MSPDTTKNIKHTKQKRQTIQRIMTKQQGTGGWGTNFCRVKAKGERPYLLTQKVNFRTSTSASKSRKTNGCERTNNTQHLRTWNKFGWGTNFCRVKAKGERPARKEGSGVSVNVGITGAVEQTRRVNTRGQTHTSFAGYDIPRMEYPFPPPSWQVSQTSQFVLVLAPKVPYSKREY